MFVCVCITCMVNSIIQVNIFNFTRHNFTIIINVCANVVLKCYFNVDLSCM